MNPSTEDMLNAIDKVNAETVFILPNNKNIVLAANQAKALVEDKKIVVIPTKTVPQGITAIINFMPDADAAANEEAMLEAIQNVKTGQVTYAVRDTKIDDKEIHEGDIMGIGDAGIIAVGTDIQNTAKEMLAAMVDEESVCTMVKRFQLRMRKALRQRLQSCIRIWILMRSLAVSRSIIM